MASDSRQEKLDRLMANSWSWRSCSGADLDESDIASISDEVADRFSASVEGNVLVVSKQEVS